MFLYYGLKNIINKLRKSVACLYIDRHLIKMTDILYIVYSIHHYAKKYKISLPPTPPYILYTP